MKPSLKQYNAPNMLGIGIHFKNNNWGVSFCGYTEKKSNENKRVSTPGGGTRYLSSRWWRPNRGIASMQSLITIWPKKDSEEGGFSYNMGGQCIRVSARMSAIKPCTWKFGHVLLWTTLKTIRTQSHTLSLVPTMTSSWKPLLIIHVFTVLYYYCSPFQYNILITFLRSYCSLYCTSLFINISSTAKMVNFLHSWNDFTSLVTCFLCCDLTMKKKNRFPPFFFL